MFSKNLCITCWKQTGLFDPHPCNPCPSAPSHRTLCPFPSQFWPLFITLYAPSHHTLCPSSTHSLVQISGGGPKRMLMRGKESDDKGKE